MATVKILLTVDYDEEQHVDGEDVESILKRCLETSFVHWSGIESYATTIESDTEEYVDTTGRNCLSCGVSWAYWNINSDGNCIACEMVGK